MITYATLLTLINCLLEIVALAGAYFAEIAAMGMPQISNHAGPHMMPEKKMTPPDLKNPAANFASAFKNKVMLYLILQGLYLFIQISKSTNT